MTEFVEQLNLCQEASDFKGGPVERGYDARRTDAGIVAVGYKGCSVLLHLFQFRDIPVGIGAHAKDA